MKKTHKKAARKAVRIKITKRPASVKNLKVGGSIKISSLKLATAPKRGSNYEEVFEAMGKLKKGRATTIDVPEGLTLPTFHNRLNAAMRRSTVKPPAGCVFRKRSTEDGKVAIQCVAKA